MILANPMEAVPILLMIFGFIAVMTAMKNRSQERQDKMRAIQKALDSGAIDEDTKRELLEAMSGQAWVRQHQRNVERAMERSKSRPSLGRFLFGFGWLALFLGVALICIGLGIGEDECVVGGSIVAGIAFGIVTLPFAFNELDRPAGRKSNSKV